MACRSLVERRYLTKPRLLSQSLICRYADKLPRPDKKTDLQPLPGRGEGATNPAAINSGNLLQMTDHQRIVVQGLVPALAADIAGHQPAAQARLRKDNRLLSLLPPTGGEGQDEGGKEQNHHPPIHPLTFTNPDQPPSPPRRPPPNPGIIPPQTMHPHKQEESVTPDPNHAARPAARRTPKRLAARLTLAWLALAPLFTQPALAAHHTPSSTTDSPPKAPLSPAG